MNRKGVLGLETVKAVMIAFLVLAVIAVAIVLTLVSIRDVAENIDTVSGTILNETITPTDTGIALAILSTYSRKPVCTITRAHNGTDGITITSPNYTVSACVFANLTSEYIDNAWNVSYTYTASASSTYTIQGNVTEGTTSFFENTNTIFAILIVVVIILAIAIIVIVVSGFGGEGKGIGGRVGLGRGRARGPGTIAGI